MNKQLLKDSLEKDFSKTINSMISNAINKIVIPPGTYIINEAIYLLDNTTIIFKRGAYLKCKKGFSSRVVFSNKDIVNGNRNIKIIGGVFDGNCNENPRPNGIHDEFTALFFTFNNVDGLILKNIEVKNTVSYHIRLGEVKNFSIKNIKFTDDYSPINQDGIHIGGGCEHGHISNVYAKPGSMGDDLIALNADDVFTFPVNYDMKPLPIRDIHVKNVKAENCWTGIRILSYKEEISNCTFKHFRIGYRTLTINMDGDRPDAIFKNSEYPDGVGNIHNLYFEDFKFWNTAIRDKKRPCIRFQNNVYNVTMKNFKHLTKNEPEGTDCASITFAYMTKMNIQIDDQLIKMEKFDQTHDCFTNKWHKLFANREN